MAYTDFSEIFELLERKLKQMEPDIREAPFVGAEKEAKNMRICIELLKRIRKEDYISDEYGELLEKWSGTLHEVKNPDGSISHQFGKLSPREEARMKYFREQAYKKQEHEYELFFKIFKNHVRRWWV